MAAAVTALLIFIVPLTAAFPAKAGGTYCKTAGVSSEQEVFAVINTVREMSGLNTFSWSEALAEDASVRAREEKEILLGMAHDESCVIAGRSGFFVLKSHPNHVSILIQAPMESRIKRVMKRQNKTEEEAKTIINKIDKMREEYVKNYAHTSRYDTRNYDLVINMDGKTEEEAVDLILKYIG